MKIKLIVPKTSNSQSTLRKLIHKFQSPFATVAKLTNHFYDTDEITIMDENRELFNLDDTPHLVMIQVYTASATRAYELADLYRARGSHVCLHGMHVTSLPDESAQHADTIILGPGEETWTKFLQDFRLGCPHRLYQSPAVTSNSWLLTYLAMYASPKAYI